MTNIIYFVVGAGIGYWLGRKYFGRSGGTAGQGERVMEIFDSKVAIEKV